MEIKLFDSERKVMEVLWREGDMTAGQLAKILKEETGWNRNTTYTVIKKCVAKGAIARSEPNFFCRALLTREQAQAQQTEELIDKMFISGRHFSKEELERLRRMIDEMK